MTNVEISPKRERVGKEEDNWLRCFCVKLQESFQHIFVMLRENLDFRFEEVKRSKKGHLGESVP